MMLIASLDKTSSLCYTAAGHLTHQYPP